jgi:hypothetical protein
VKVTSLKYGYVVRRRSNMNWDFVIQLILAIFGVAFIAGGIVAYRGSPRTGVRAFGASAVAAGVVMWAVVLLTVQVSTSGGGSPDPIVEGVKASEQVDR